jgi:hypothetical protein
MEFIEIMQNDLTRIISKKLPLFKNPLIPLWRSRGRTLKF